MKRFSLLARVLTMLMCIGAWATPALAQPRPQTPQPARKPEKVQPARPEDEADTQKDKLTKQSEAAFDKRDFKAAEAAIRQLIEIDGTNFVPWYNLACALSMQDRTTDAGPALEKAIELGFSDLETLRRDPHLEALRRTANYKRLAANWGDILNSRIETSLDGIRKGYGPGYTVEKNDALRLAYVSAFAPGSFSQAKVEIDRLTAWWETNVATPVTGSVLENKPLASEPGEQAKGESGASNVPWVLVVLPTQKDYASWAEAKFGAGWQRIGGSYSHDEKKLVAKDLGSTLRHEYWHVLHWRDMTARRQQHPIWIMEGLCSLPEDLDTDAGDVMKPIASWRTNQARHVAKNGKLMPWEVLFAADQKRFMGTKPLAYYAQSRCIFLYLHSRGLLKDWYTAYVEGYSEDRTGAKAMEKVFAKPLAEVQKDYTIWLRSLPEVQEEFRPGDAVLPFDLEEGAGDGVIVLMPVSLKSRPKGTGGMRGRDVITGVDGKPVREMAELIQVLGAYVPGTEVEVSYRRGKTTGTAKVTLASFK